MYICVYALFLSLARAHIGAVEKNSSCSVDCKRDYIASGFGIYVYMYARWSENVCICIYTRAYGEFFRV